MNKPISITSQRIIKDHKRKIFSVMFVFLALLLLCWSDTQAETAESLEQKIQSHQGEIDKLNEELAKYQSELLEVSKQSSSLSNEIKKIDLTKKKLETDIKVTEQKIDKTDLKLEELSNDIYRTEGTISSRRDVISSNIRKLNTIGDITIVEMIASGKSFSETWRHVDNIAKFQTQIRENVVALSNTKKELVVKEDETQSVKDEYLELRSKLDDQKQIVVQNESEKKRLLGETKNKESNYSKLVAEKQALIKAFENELQSYESQLVYILDPSSIPSSGSAPLSWPIDNAFITQQFGITSDSKRLYLSGSHSGVDFRGAVGTPVYAMASGTVEGVGDTDVACRGASFGKWVLIKYDNNLASTYGHLSLIKAQKGDRVAKGTIVGYSGNTGRSTAPHLHVSLYVGDAVKVEGKESIACKGKILIQPRAATNAYLDPLSYMPRTTASMFK